MSKKYSFYPLHQCLLYKCKSKKQLSSHLGYDLKTLLSIVNNIENHYKIFSINKVNSTKTRLVCSPTPQLKSIQTRILKLLNRVEKPHWLISSTLGKSYINNAVLHLGNKYIVKTDIKSFFDNCTRDRVYRFFKDKLKTVPDVAKLLTDLTTFKQGIPTGSPTSQILAYFAYEDMFKNMHVLSKKYDYTMSLYVDDIVFSNNRFKDHKAFMRNIEIEALRYNHSLKASKTRSYNTLERGALITGVILKNAQLKIPNSLRHSTISSFSQLKNNAKISNSQIQSIKGKIHAARLIEQSHFNGIYSFSNSIQANN
ncbi:reverse transcriptase family protein [Staphylococcus simulans]|uniref:reverse transcriptase family protein n=1 Tax=Staphylococcus simulans TaxID=1286 RepID=UPI0021D36DC9|nr:reverse transcriptase family protein [Staphylococcus simulans]UXR38012.1 reverse transcriptase family protein [Staphylococcus simulans]